MAKKCAKCYALTQRLNRREKQLTEQTGQLQAISQTILLAGSEAEQTGRSEIISLCKEIAAVLNNQLAPVRRESHQEWQGGVIMGQVNKFKRWLGFGESYPVLHRDGPPAMTVVAVPEGVPAPDTTVPDGRITVPSGLKTVPTPVPEGVPTPVPAHFSMNLADFRRIKVQLLESYLERESITAKLLDARYAPQALVIELDLVREADLAKLEKDRPLALALKVPLSSVSVRNQDGQLCCIVNLPDHLRQAVYSKDLSGGAIGLDLDGQPVTLPFSKTNNSLFVVGIQGTGKTELLQTILHAFTHSHGVGELELLVIDHRDSLVAFDNLAHLVRPRVTDPNAVNDALASVVANAPKRGNKAVPLYVLIDEVGELVTQYGLEPSMLGKVANQRRYNVHIIAATQQVNKETTGDFANWSTMRIFGNLASANQSGRIAGAGVNAHLLQPPGDFMLIQSGHAQRFQAALTTLDQITHLPRVGTEPVLLQAPRKPEPAKPLTPKVGESSITSVEPEVIRIDEGFYNETLLAAELAHYMNGVPQLTYAQVRKAFGWRNNKTSEHRKMAKRIYDKAMGIIEEQNNATRK